MLSALLKEKSVPEERLKQLKVLVKLKIFGRLHLLQMQKACTLHL